MANLVEESCSALTERVQKISEAHTNEDIWRYLDAHYYMCTNLLCTCISRLYGEFTMETILATAFGYKVELLRGKVDGGDELIKTAQDIFNVPNGGGIIGVTLMSLNCKSCLQIISFKFILFSPAHFHWLTPLLRFLGTRLPMRSKFLTVRKTALSFVQARKNSPTTKVCMSYIHLR